MLCRTRSDSTAIGADGTAPAKVAMDSIEDLGNAIPDVPRTKIALVEEGMKSAFQTLMNITNQKSGQPFTHLVAASHRGLCGLKGTTACLSLPRYKLRAR